MSLAQSQRNLRNRQDLADSAWDWGFLNDALKIGDIQMKVSDGDGLLEHNGDILLFEGRRDGEREEIKKGHRRLLRVFSTKPGCSSVVIWGDPEGGIVRRRQWARNGKWENEEVTKTEWFIEELRQWVEVADSHRNTARGWY